MSKKELMLQTTYVIDIDGVIAYPMVREARALAIDPTRSSKFYEVFFDPAGVEGDEVVPGTLEIIKKIHATGSQIVYLTSRPESMRYPTVAFFAQRGFLGGELDSEAFCFKPDSLQYCKTAYYKEAVVIGIMAITPHVVFVDDEPEHRSRFAAASGTEGYASLAEMAEGEGL